MEAEAFAATALNLRNRRIERLVRILFLLMTLVLIVPVVAILASLIYKGGGIISFDFLFNWPNWPNRRGTLPRLS